MNTNPIASRTAVRALVVLTGINLLNYLDRYVVSPIVPDLKGAMSLTDAQLGLLVPAFMLSELKRAFEIGFLIFVPFLIIDMAVASILMSMGMMMLPPIVISLPFKLIFFVLVDGWRLVSGSLVESFQRVTGSG